MRGQIHDVDDHKQIGGIPFRRGSGVCTYPDEERARLLAESSFIRLPSKCEPI